jgi:ubiquinone/menaquinone biosynthesis C-methylase UbiE
MTSSLTSRSILPLLLVTLLVPATASAQPSGITNGQIFEAIGLRDGATVCEMGAGDGELTLAAARLVGPAGHVYTSELGDERVKALREKVARSNLSQITIVAGDANKTNFPDGGCDALFMRSVYHHFADPAAMNASIAAALKPGARLAIVDFTPPPGSEAACPADRGKDGMHGITAETLSRELKDAGFEAVSSIGVQRAIMVVVSKARSGSRL